MQNLKKKTLLVATSSKRIVLPVTTNNCAHAYLTTAFHFQLQTQLMQILSALNKDTVLNHGTIGVMVLVLCVHALLCNIHMYVVV